MTLRDRLTEAIGGRKLRQEREQNQEAFNTLYSAYQDGPFRMPPEMLVERLSELDNSTLIYLIRSMQSSNVTGLPYNASAEDARLYQVNESRFQWLYSPLSQWSVNVWTSYGLGEKVTVTCEDDEAQERWKYAWDNSTIFDDDRIHEMSNWTCVDGEVYLAAFHNIVDGSTVFELLSTDEIKEIVTLPENKNTPLFYKREWTGADNSNYCVYYPDYHVYFNKPEELQKAKLPVDAITSISEAMDVNNGTSVTILHIAHNRKDASNLHGWPVLGIASPYMRAHKEFVESRLTVAKQKAMFAREFIAQGGSRAVSAVKAKFGQQLTTGGTYTTTDGNPPAISGSNLIHNQAVEHRDLPMTTGAGDASTDNNMFAWMALIGAGLFPTTAGMDTSRWATAVAMDKTQAVQWAKYQSFWGAQFRKMVEIVLYAAEKWGGETFEDKTCTVSIDTLSLTDFPGVVDPIAAIIRTMPDLLADGTLRSNPARELLQALYKPVLTALGTEGVDEILSDDNLGITAPEKAEEVAQAMVNLALDIRRRKIAEKAGADDKPD